MTSLRTLALEGADAVALAFQSASQHFGFLSANRESVVERDADGSRVAVLLDKRSEGWPAVELPLPSDATFLHATNAVLSRTAAWSTAEAPAAVLARVTAYFTSARATESQTGSVSTVSLPGLAATIRIGAAPRRTLIAVCQRRSPESIHQVLKAKASAR